MTTSELFRIEMENRELMGAMLNERLAPAQNARPWSLDLAGITFPCEGEPINEGEEAMESPAIRATARAFDYLKTSVFSRFNRMFCLW